LFSYEKDFLSDVLDEMMIKSVYKTFDYMN